MQKNLTFLIELNKKPSDDHDKDSFQMTEVLMAEVGFDAWLKFWEEMLTTEGSSAEQLKLSKKREIDAGSASLFAALPSQSPKKKMKTMKTEIGATAATDGDDARDDATPPPVPQGPKRYVSTMLAAQIPESSGVGPTSIRKFVPELASFLARECTAGGSLFADSGYSSLWENEHGMLCVEKAPPTLLLNFVGHTILIAPGIGSLPLCRWADIDFFIDWNAHRSLFFILAHRRSRLVRRA